MVDKVISKAQVVDLISDGKAVVIYDGYVLNLSPWISRHPGGDLAIFHMVGRDATDEMNAYHGPDTMASFKKWKIGKIDTEMWENLLPPIQGADYSSAPKSESGHGASLEAKLDAQSTGSLMTLSSTSLLLLLSLDHTKTAQMGAGYPAGPVTPRVPQNRVVTKANAKEIFPTAGKGKVVDPRDQMVSQYDNKLTLADLDKLPDLDYETQNWLRDEYNKLHDELEAHNLFDCNLWNYVRELVKIGSLLLYLFLFLKCGYLMLSALFMGMAWHQMTFIAHDAGHVALTHNYQIDNTFGMIIASWCGGLSLGWWKRNHNVHHLVTNDPVHDPDIQHLPFFAVLVQFIQLIYSTYYQRELTFDKAAQVLIKYQHWLYHPILCFGRFNLYRLLWEHLILGKGPRQGRAAWFRPFEIFGLSFFFYWFFYLVVWRLIDGGWNRFNYVMVSHIATMLVHVQITLLHFAMSTADLGVSELFPSRQLRTTMDVDCPVWLDFFHGGLQFQAIHHLFPRMPRHNLRSAQPYVIKFGERVGLNYSIYGFGHGNEMVLSKLEQIGKQARIIMDATRNYQGDLY